MSTNDDVPSLTPNQILALVVLMAEARELTNNDLKELAGFALTGADNAKLETSTDPATGSKTAPAGLAPPHQPCHHPDAEDRHVRSYPNRHVRSYADTG